MRVEGCVVDFRKRDSIRDHWLTKPIVFIGNDVRSVEQQRFGKARKRTASIVSCYYRFPACCLMQPLLDRAQRVSSLHAVCGGSHSFWIRSKRYTGLKCLALPPGNAGRKEGLAVAWRYPQHITAPDFILV